MNVQKRTFFTIIQQGTKGVRLTLGSKPVLLEPGINIRIPLLHQLQKVDLRETAIPVGIGKKYFTSDNVPVYINGSLFYQKKDAFKCFNINNPEERVADIGTSAMRSVIGTFEYDEIISDNNKLNIKRNYWRFY